MSETTGNLGTFRSAATAAWRNACLPLCGRTITAMSYQSAEEMEAHGWTRAALVLQLDDGTLLYASADDEGNDAGALFIQPSDKLKAEGVPECAPVI